MILNDIYIGRNSGRLLGSECLIILGNLALLCYRFYTVA
jgi:hypothetical protein